MVPLFKEADEIAQILRNLKIDCEIDHQRGYYRIQDQVCMGLLSFIGKARRALRTVGIELPLP